MKRYTYLLPLALLAAGCDGGDDDDPAAGGIEGRWTLTDYQLTQESLDEDIPFTVESVLTSGDFAVEFAADGSYTQEGIVTLLSRGESEGEDLGSQTYVQNWSRDGTYEVADGEITGVVFVLDPNFPEFSKPANAYEVDNAADELILRYETIGTTIVNYTEVVDFEVEIEVFFERE